MATTQDDREQELARRQSDTEQADVFENARAKQRAADAETRAYENNSDIDAGTDQAEAYANDPAHASSRSQGSKRESSDSRGSNANDSLGDRFRNAAGRVGGAIKGVGGFVGGHKKGFAAGGGIAGLILTLIFGFFSLLPLKLESMMKNIVGDHSEVIESAMERRAMRLMLQYASRYSNAAIGPNGAIVATGSPLTDLYRTWKTQKFEASLAEKQGLKIERSNVAGKTIKITYGSQSVDGANENELVEHFNNREAKAALNQILKDNTKWHQVIKRAHLRRWMRNAYGIKKWKVFEDKKGQAAKDGVDADIRTTVRTSYKEKVGKGISCLFGVAADCPGRQASDGGAGNGGQADGRKAATDLSNTIDEVPAGTVGTDAIEKALSEKAVTVLSKAIPIVGWIDLAARMDKLVWENTTVRIIQDIRKAQYAAVFAQFVQMSDQIKAGETVSGDEVNAVMTKLEGSEKSAAFQRLYVDSASGEAADPDSLFGTSFLSGSRDVYTNLTLNDCGLAGNSCPAVFNAIPIHGPYHSIAVAYLDTLGKLFDWAGDLVSGVLNKIPGIADLNEFIGKIVMKGFMAVLGPVLTGDETGSQLFTAMDVGGDTTYNDFAQSLGGQKLDAQTVYNLKNDITADRAVAVRNKGLFYQYLSPDNTYSPANKLIAGLPASPKAAVSLASNTMMAVVASPLKSLSSSFSGSLLSIISPVHAADVAAADPYGIDQYGFTEAQLSGQIDEQALTAAAVRGNARDTRVGTGENINISYMLPEDCDENPDAPVEPNMCKIDLAVAQSLKAMYTTEDDGGVNSLDGGVIDNGNGTAPAPGGTAGTGALPTEAAGILAQEILSNPRITLEDTTVRRDLQATVNGQVGTAGTAISRTLLAIIAALGRAHSISISALEDEGRGHKADSVHYAGRAVDFTAFDGKRTDGRDPQSIALIDAIKGQLPSGSGIGQSQCPGATPVLPAGINTFTDACTHVHVQLPRSAE